MVMPNDQISARLLYLHVAGGVLHCTYLSLIIMAECMIVLILQLDKDGERANMYIVSSRNATDLMLPSDC